MASADGCDDRFALPETIMRLKTSVSRWTARSNRSARSRATVDLPDAGSPVSKKTRGPAELISGVWGSGATSLRSAVDQAEQITSPPANSMP